MSVFENTLDSYAHSNGLRDVNTYYKVIFAIVTMVVSLVSQSPIVPFIIFGFITALIIFKAKISYKFYLKFLSVPFIFALINLIFMAIFFGVGQPVLQLGIFNLAVTVDGFNLGFLLLARVMAGFSCLAFLALTTPMTELFSVFEDIKIPQIVIELAMLMYRYIFLFLDEAINMYHAQETRMGYSSYKKSYKSMGMLASNLFIKTWVKGEQATVAMESRCYDGSIKTMKEPENIMSIGINNLSLLLLFELVLVAGVYFTGTLNVM